jgi:hypothetical protein
MSKKLAAIAVAFVVVLGAGAYAYADNATPGTPSVSAAAGAAGIDANAAVGKGRRALAILRHADHGDLSVRTKDGFRTVTFDRGKVTAASDTSITVMRPDGVSVTKTIDASTKFKGISSASDIKTGKGAIVVSDGDTALAVAQAARG